MYSNKYKRDLNWTYLIKYFLTLKSQSRIPVNKVIQFLKEKNKTSKFYILAWTDEKNIQWTGSSKAVDVLQRWIA